MTNFSTISTSLPKTTIYVASSSGVFVSEDSGQTWKLVDQTQ